MFYICSVKRKKHTIMKRFFVAYVILLSQVIAYAQEDYRPLVEEGKRWTYDNYLSVRPEKYNHYYWYELSGDTIINSQTCLKMYSDNKYNDGLMRYECALYEIEKRVYCFFANKEEPVLLYDFGCQVGDKLNTSEGTLTVTNIYPSQNGNRNLRYTQLSVDGVPDEEGLIYWIEGVGCIKDFFGMAPYPGNYNSLVSCEVYGEFLYEYVQPKLTEDGYHEMGIEGKTWNYIHHYEDESGVHEEPYSYVVKGDTVLGRTVCKKVYYRDATSERLAFTMMEIERGVYLRNPGGKAWTQPYEFGRYDIGRVFDWNSAYGRGHVFWMLNTIDTIAVRGQDFRRLIFLQKTIEGGRQDSLTHINDDEDVWHEIWIEGVGSQYTGIEYPIHEEPPVSKDYTRFVSCYENGQCIFTAEDFTTAIHNVPAPQIANRKSLNGKCYDLSGRRIVNSSLLTPHSSLPKGIYIKDGKKVVVK